MSTQGPAPAIPGSGAMRYAAALLIGAATACSSGSASPPNHDDTKSARPAPSVPTGGDAASPTGAQMQITYDVPDEAWRKAGETVMATWRDALAARAAAATVRPLRSPDGATVPFLLVVTTAKADGAADFTGAALVWDGALQNKRGKDAAVAFLAGSGFPKAPMPLGHLVQALFVTDAIPQGWVRPPVPAGWQVLTEKLALIDELPARLEYAKGGATLSLYRSGASTGGGHTPPPTERLQIHFAKDASMTFDAARRVSGTKAWQAFTP
jgi:hypothetical protein